MPTTTSQDIEVYTRSPRPSFEESIQQYIDTELAKIETAIRNIRDAIKTAEDRLTAGGL